MFVLQKRKCFSALGKCRFLLLLLLLFSAQTLLAEEHYNVMPEQAMGHSKFSSPALLPLPSPVIIKKNSRQEKIISLGYHLYRDRHLSGDDQFSCFDCHDLNQGGSNGQTVARQGSTLNVPSIFNMYNRVNFYRNGRAHNLSELIDMAISNDDEMASDWRKILSYLKQNSFYSKQFQTLFKKAPEKESVNHVMTSYVRQLAATDAPLDRYLSGDGEALDRCQKRGYEIFLSAGCQACHQGSNIGANLYQKLGVVNNYEEKIIDGSEVGTDRDRRQITGRSEDRHRFLVPSLRNVTKTAPYLHDGSIDTLRDVVELMFQYQLGRDVGEAELSSIVNFFTALEGQLPEQVK